MISESAVTPMTREPTLPVHDSHLSRLLVRMMPGVHVQFSTLLSPPRKIELAAGRGAARHRDDNPRSQRTEMDMYIYNWRFCESATAVRDEFQHPIRTATDPRTPPPREPNSVPPHDPPAGPREPAPQPRHPQPGSFPPSPSDPPMPQQPPDFPLPRGGYGR